MIVLRQRANFLQPQPASSSASAVLILMLVVVLAPQAYGQAPAPADRVYRNAVIFTADSQNTTAEALAIRDGKIIFVGSNPGVAPLIGPDTTNVDLQGRFLMPGLIDGH